MNHQVFESHAAQETFAFGKALAKDCHAGDVILLNGDLGVGKTVFSKGFGAGLGITEPMASPTFTLLKIYEEGRLPLYHFDVYRIEDPDEMYEIGYEDYFYGKGVCLVEWAERIRELVPEDAVCVCIEKDLEKGLDYRKITVTQ